LNEGVKSPGGIPFPLRVARSREFWIVLLIFLAALGLRILNVLEFRANDPAFGSPLPGADMHGFYQWATNILDTNWVDAENTPPFQAPLYPYIVALVMRIFGKNPLWVKLFHAFIGSLSCVLVYFIGKKVFNPAVGLIAAFLMCFYGLFMLYEAFLLRATLLTFFYLLAILSLLVAKESGRIFSYLAAGACLGLNAVMRPNVLLFVPPAALWIWFAVGEESARKKIVFVAVLLAGVVIAIAPVTAKNYIVGEKFVLIGQNGGLCFFIGNSHDATGTLSPIESVLRIVPQFPMIDMREMAKINWLEMAVDQLSKNPVHFVRMFFRKLVLYLMGYEIPNNVNYYLSKRFSAVFRLPLLTFWVMLPFAVTGAIVSVKEWPKQALLLLFISTYTISILVLFVLARYRLPMVPYLLIFAAYALFWWFEKARKGEIKKIALSLAPLALVGAFSFLTRAEYIRGNDYSNLALAYEEQGRYDLAAPEYLNALKVDPRYSYARRKLVSCYIALGQSDRALDTAIEGVRIESVNPKEFFDLAGIFQEKGELGAAIESLEWVLLLNPQHMPACRKLGYLYAEQGRFDQARAQWLEVFKANPDDEEAIENLKRLQPKPRPK